MNYKRERQRLRRRLGAYKRYPLYVYMFESDFAVIFERIRIRHGWSSKKTFNEIIDDCTDEEVIEINQNLDCYQIDKKQKG